MLRAIAYDQAEGPAEVQSVSIRSPPPCTSTGSAPRSSRASSRPPDGPPHATLRWSSAGHLPPLLTTTAPCTCWAAPRTGCSGPTYPSGAATTRLGCGPVTRCCLHRRAGPTRLGSLTDEPLDQVYDRLLDHLAGGRTDDDIALLAVRLQPPSGTLRG